MLIALSMLSSVLTGILMEKWKKAKTFDEQDFLWITWTGEGLPREPWWQDEDRLRPDEPNGPKWMRESIRLSPTADELPRLKKLGWETAKGEPLPLTPRGIWEIEHLREIKDLEQTVSENQDRSSDSHSVWRRFLVAFGTLLATKRVGAGVAHLDHPRLSGR